MKAMRAISDMTIILRNNKLYLPSPISHSDAVINDNRKFQILK